MRDVYAHRSITALAALREASAPLVAMSEPIAPHRASATAHVVAGALQQPAGSG